MATFNMNTHLITRKKGDLEAEVYNVCENHTILRLLFISDNNNQRITISLNKETALNLIPLLELFANNMKDGDFN